ncbi:hypothetical protein B0A69_00160 [Chryseobacterium shigense]|uniref:site-specific DNA-methyltransferase (adenine-specific) n=1 Tax=Chryseobacterium shigense TaxID=297244 RepID=A0A1N7I0E0_9FLAO|nr:Eco57I restriction-modification methylase domain-containing protein [Chryseobacterium shigense]PQA97788.1 hypothetical protein B0A69_00160 [Chryseobacterium shigense]SIS30514.1 TaqI-like C-terminal specificity domain-containing protein [Chryseobacterium shigense]
MDRRVINFLKKYTYKEANINKILVSAFLHTNNITLLKNRHISSLILHDNSSDDYNHFVKFITFYESPITIEELLNVFEFVISPEDKEVNGSVYTPVYIRDFIVDQCFEKYPKKIIEAKFGDISCGCGGFFLTIANKLFTKYNLSFKHIYENNIFGIDIQNYSIERTKILLSLNAIIQGEDDNFNFNLFIGNSLDFEWNQVRKIKKNKGLDIIVGNPPYVGSSKIDLESKILLKKWSVSNSGKADLYIPFFQIGIENLAPNGVLGYITVNNFQRSLNGRSLRSYFADNELSLEIIDFKAQQVFKNRSTYTCICFVSNSISKVIKYAYCDFNKLIELKQNDFLNIPYESLNIKDGWHLVDDSIKEVINIIESTGKKLGNIFDIKNGFATLKNDIYVFTPIREDSKYYYFKRKNLDYKIEKPICIDTIKPNTLNNQDEIVKKIEKLIFPYLFVNNKDLFGTIKRSVEIIEELSFKKKYPFAYSYLSEFKKILADRDMRGENNWYSFGRSQALNIYGNKLFLPYITDKPCFVYSDNKELLFYNGYAIISENEFELRVLQKILMSGIFWFYIKNTSKPYSGGYYSVAKNYIKNFGICLLNNEEKRFLYENKDNNIIHDFLINKYGLKKYNIPKLEEF